MAQYVIVLLGTISQFVIVLEFSFSLTSKFLGLLLAANITVCMSYLQTEEPGHNCAL